MLVRVARRLDKSQGTPTPAEVVGECAAAHSELLTQLFPRFRTDSDAEDDGSRLYRRRNIVRLLYLGNPPGAISRMDIERVWSIVDSTELQASLHALRENGTLPAFLDHLDDLLARLPASGDATFWPALSRVLTRSTDWMTGPTPEYGLVDDAATTLVRLGLRDSSQKRRVKTAVAALIASGDLAITPWILRKQMYAHGLSKHSRSGGGESVYTKDETLDLMRLETPRYRKAVLDGTALRRLPNVEAIYVIANQNAWDDELRASFTQQLQGRDAISTIAALILPPGHGSDRKALSELFDPDRVSEELRQARFDKPPMQPWIESAVRRFNATLDGRDPSFDYDDNDAEETPGTGQ
jgi:hypothetical protein